MRVTRVQSCSLGVHVDLVFLEVGGNGLHDFLSLCLVVDHQGVQVPGGSELEFSDSGLLVLLDSDLFGLGEMLLLSPHDLDELLQILDFLGLRAKQNTSVSHNTTN